MPEQHKLLVPGATMVLLQAHASLNLYAGTIQERQHSCYGCKIFVDKIISSVLITIFKKKIILSSVRYLLFVITTKSRDYFESFKVW